MEANYVHKDSTTLVQDELVKNELNQIELQYNALKQQKFNELLKENQELKKQVEERTKMYQNAYDYSQKMEGKAIILEAQQKEFINYLEDEIQKKREKATTLTSFTRNVVPLKHCLQKYKSIIGVSDENSKN